MKLLLTTLYILAQYVDILADIIGLAIGTLGLDKAEIYNADSLPKGTDVSGLRIHRRQQGFPCRFHPNLH